MKNIVFLGLLEENKDKNGGYINATFCFLNALKDLKEKNKIDDLVILDLNKFYSFNEEKKYDIGIVFLNPTSLLNAGFLDSLKYKFKNVKNVYLNILWETVSFPEKWEGIFKDDFFTGFIVSSHFLFYLLENYTKKPIYYIPYYFEDNYLSLVDLKEKEKEEKFTVLFIGQNTERKSLIECVVSFIIAFHNNPKAQLLIKSFNLNKQEKNIEDKIKELIKLNTNNKINSQIFLIEKELSLEEMEELYRFSSCLIFPSKGEGFGLPIAEAMLIGLPVIYSYNSASIEVGESEYNIKVECTPDFSFNMFLYGYDYKTYVFYPKIKDLVSGLEKLYDLWEKDRKTYYLNSFKNRNIILKRFPKEKTLLGFQNLLNGEPNSKNIIDNQLLNYYNDTLNFLLVGESK